VAALDVDGTLGDHYLHTVDFAQLWLGRKIDYRPEDGWPPGAVKFQFHRAMGISKGTYRKIKLAYRQGGMIRSMPCYDGAQELVDGLRKAGFAVWICTTRPYMRLDNMATDTTHWLKRNRLKVDGLIASDYKYYDLVKAVGRESIVAALDDLPEMCDQANRAGIEAILMSRPHNELSPWEGTRASNLKQALKILTDMR